MSERQPGWVRVGFRRVGAGAATVAAAPSTSTYITQTPDASLTNEQALSLLATGLLKSTTGTGVVSIAAAGTDYEVPLTFSTGLTRAVNTISANLSTGVAGGQSVIGGVFAGNDLTLVSTSNATRGRVLCGSFFALDEVNSRVLIGTQTAGAGAPLTIATNNGTAISLSFAGAQVIDKSGGLLQIGTSGAFSAALYTGNVVRQTLASDGKTTWQSTPFFSLTDAGAAVAQSQGRVVEWAITPPAVASAAGAVLDAHKWAAATVTLSGSTNVTNATGFNFLDIEQPTYTAGSALTISNAVTLAIKGPPIAGGSVTITTAYAIWSQAGIARFDGAFGVNIGPSAQLFASMVATTTRDMMFISPGGGPAIADGTARQYVDISPGTTVVTPTTAGTQWLTVRFRQQTFTLASGSASLVQAATVWIDGPPVFSGAGSFGTGYLNEAFHVDSGISRFVGIVKINTAGGVNALFVDGPNQIVGVFGTSSTQRVNTAGNVTAGATYTATERAMLTDCYSALRAYGWLT